MDTTKQALKTLRPRIDDDPIDKVNYFWTTMILVVCSLTIAMRQYVGRPLQCWVPAEFKGYWQQYAEDYCFVENTYFVPMNESIPDSGVERVQRELGYYQWVPIVLALQAFMFFLPRLIWSMLNSEGLNFQAILEAASGVVKEKGRQRLKLTDAVKKDTLRATGYMDDFVKYRKHTKSIDKSAPTGRFAAAGMIDTPPSYDPRSRQKRGGRGPISITTSSHGYYTTVLYVIVKLAYIANVIGQFFVMNAYLSPKYSWWGFGIVNDIWNGIQWHDSGHFPRVTLCDFTVRRLGNLQTFTIQCVLSLNMLNERMYLFIWWWFLLVAVLSILSFIYWLVISFNPISRRRFVARYMLVRNLVSKPPPRPETQDHVKRFVDSYLKMDGVLLLRLISCNAGEIACANMIEQLWLIYNRSPPPLSSVKPKKTAAPPPPPPPPLASSSPAYNTGTTATIDNNEGFIESPNNSLDK